jgi:hypothetical protein
MLADPARLASNPQPAETSTVEVVPTDVVVPVERLIEYKFPVTTSTAKYDPVLSSPVFVLLGLGSVPEPMSVAAPVDGVICINWFDVLYS